MSEAESGAATLVVGALAERGGRLLLARRGPAERHAGLWELPGGKVEPGEEPRAALRRELAEELGVAADIGAEAGRYPASIGGRRFDFIVHRADWAGEPAFLAAHDALAWVLPAELAAYEVAPLDAPALADWAAGEAGHG